MTEPEDIIPTIIAFMFVLFVPTWVTLLTLAAIIAIMTTIWATA